MDASCRCHEMRHEALFSLAQQCERTDLDLRGGRYASHDRWQVCCMAGYASVERRRAVAIAPLMLASQHDYVRLESMWSTFESELYGTGPVLVMNNMN